MTTKKKRQTSPAGRRMATVALSLCLLAGVTLFGMYTVGKTEEQQRRLEQEVADAEKAAQARQQTAKTAIYTFSRENEDGTRTTVRVRAANQTAAREALSQTFLNRATLCTVQDGERYEL